MDAWFRDEMPARVRHRLNDAVDIVAGEHQGGVGAVISLCAIEREPVYSVELSDGATVSIPQSALRGIEE